MSAIIALDGINDINLLNVSLSAIMGAALVGMMDDILDMNQRFKAFLPFVLALPFGSMVFDEVVIPHVVTLDFGGFMILAAAFAVTCAANAANMLEGFNGLGTGLGIIMALTLVVLSLVHDRLDGGLPVDPTPRSTRCVLVVQQVPGNHLPRRHDDAIHGSQIHA